MCRCSVEMSAKKKFVLYQDLDGTTYDVELPLTSNVDAAELRENLRARD